MKKPQLDTYVLSDAATDRTVKNIGIRAALGVLGGIAGVMLFNRKSSPRPFVGGRGTGKFWTGVGWWWLGGAVGQAIGLIVAPLSGLDVGVANAALPPVTSRSQ